MQEPSTAQVTDAPPPVAAPPAADAAYGETWFGATGHAARARPPLRHDIDVDVCVVGAGLAGLTVAREVAVRGWSVAVLEQRRVAWNASSRNSGFVLPGFAQDVGTLIERVGPDRARELWSLSQGGVDYVRRAIKDARMRDTMQSEGYLHVSKTDRARALADRAETLRGFGADIEVWPAALVRTKVKSPYYFQAIHFPTAFNIHPYNYAIQLAQSAEDAGARIFEDTAAVSIDPAGVRKRVATAHGRVRANHVVFAGNVHLGPLMPEVSQTLIPVHTFAVVTRPLGETLASAIEYPGAVSDTDFAGHHYRIVGGDRLIFAGRMATREGGPRYGRRLRADLRQRFPQLGTVEIEQAWGGATGVAVHRMPQIGEVTPGIWLASGFGGQGINTIAMAGTLIAGAIVDGDDRVRLFEPFELVWAGGRAGRFIAKRVYALRRSYEQWASRRSRRKELWWIANEPRLKKEAEEAAERARIREEKAAAAEAARIERDKREAEQAELRRLERERVAAEQAEAKRTKAERKAAARAEAARLKEERRAAKRAQVHDPAVETLEADDAPRADAQRAEAERIEAAHRQAELVAENAARLMAEQAEAEKAASAQAEEAGPPATQQAEIEAAGPRVSADPVASAPVIPEVAPSAALEHSGEPEQGQTVEPKARRRGFWRR